MKKIGFLAAAAMTVMVLSCSQPVTVQHYDIVPFPEKIEMAGGFFTLNKDCCIVYEVSDDETVTSNMARNAEFLKGYLAAEAGFDLEVYSSVDAPQKSGTIVLELDGDTPECEDGACNEDRRLRESYGLDIDEHSICISGHTEAGVFYGIQTLRKIIAAPVADGVPSQLRIACGEVEDTPRFTYRGSHLDVSRHTFSMDFIKRYIDILALHNINVFHWHLTDDQGWRIEIKSRPKLVEKGSMRSGTVIKQDWGTSDNIPYGGYFTQEQAREIVEYAAQRYITVIPEIDMPGHMLAALTAYPELGCTGGPYEVWTRWGISDDVLCIGNEETFKFLEDVFSEIIDIFPSEYIHVGGDECPKVRWETCPKCRAKMAELGLRDDVQHTAEQKLQSYAIERIEKFINSKGRRIIGWDEILEGGLAPNAAVMSWTGIEGGTQAALMGHDVVMVPTSYLYFDYYQSTDRENEPFAIGGYVSVERVYSFDPIPQVLKDTEAQEHIIGVQANLWTEYVLSGEHAEYMLLPRMAALSEVQWSQPQKKDYSDFLRRVKSLTRIYDVYGYNYARHIFDVKPELSMNYDNNTIEVSLSSLMGDPVYYTIDGTPLTDADGNISKSAKLYAGAFSLSSSATLNAATLTKNGCGRVYSKEISFSKSTAHKARFLTEPHPGYVCAGAQTLVDGVRGRDNYKSGEWVAFYNNDMEIVIDMACADGSVPQYSQVSFNVFVLKGDWIHDVRKVEISVSDDSQTFRTVAQAEYPALSQDDPDGIMNKTFDFEPQDARYLKVKASPEYSLPQWHTGKGKPSFVFVDEIAVK